MSATYSDFRGKAITEGAEIAYAGRRGARCWLTEATVVESNRGQMAGIKVQRKEDGVVVTLVRLDTIAVLG